MISRLGAFDPPASVKTPCERGRKARRGLAACHRAR